MANMQQMLLAISGGYAAYLPNYIPGAQDVIISVSESLGGGGPAAAQVSLELYSDGTGKYIEYTSVGGTVDLATFTWLTGSGTAADYYAYMDAPSFGSFDFGTTGSPLVLSSNRSWSISAYAYAPTPPNDSQSKNAISTLRIRNSLGTDLITKTINITAFAEAIAV